jgi:hypothetical protein
MSKPGIAIGRRGAKRPGVASSGQLAEYPEPQPELAFDDKMRDVAREIRARARRDSEAGGRAAVTDYVDGVAVPGEPGEGDAHTSRLRKPGRGVPGLSKTPAPFRDREGIPSPLSGIRS